MLKILKILAAIGAIMISGCANTAECNATDYSVSLPPSVPIFGGRYQLQKTVTCQPDDMSPHATTK
jgi:hypothetical protein